MRFSVFTHVQHIRSEKSIYAYSPYVREMKLWFSQAAEVEIVAPITSGNRDSISIPYQYEGLIFTVIPSFHFLSLKDSFQALFKIPLIVYKIFGAMYRSDHIHLRCPGNIGLIACIVQILFPKKPKSIKYAGNWDPNAIQPWSYKLQKRILSNTFLTRNAKVLVYGNWPNQSKNILPFFTASFSEAEKTEFHKEFKPFYRLLFVGSLVPGKNPFFAIQLLEALMRKGMPAKLEFYGDGLLKKDLQAYLKTKNLEPFVSLMGNQKQEVLRETYKNSHFLVLASKSEGWPKAVAEAMFFGCIPVAAAVSCVPWMLGAPPAPEGGAKFPPAPKGGVIFPPVLKGRDRMVTITERGILIPDLEKGNEIKMDNGKKRRVDSQDVLNETAEKILELIKGQEKMKRMALSGQEWSQQYTLEKFESEIKKLL